MKMVILHLLPVQQHNTLVVLYTRRRYLLQVYNIHANKKLLTKKTQSQSEEGKAVECQDCNEWKQ